MWSGPIPGPGHAAGGPSSRVLGAGVGFPFLRGTEAVSLSHAQEKADAEFTRVGRKLRFVSSGGPTRLGLLGPPPCSGCTPRLPVTHAAQPHRPGVRPYKSRFQSEAQGPPVGTQDPLRGHEVKAAFITVTFFVFHSLRRIQWNIPEAT